MAGSARDKWAKHVQRWKDSGLTAREFASEMGLNAGMLSYWKWRLGKEAKARPLKRPRKRGQALARRKSERPVQFVELDASAPVSSDRLELLVGGRYTVRVPDGFGSDTLRRVIDVVEERP